MSHKITTPGCDWIMRRLRISEIELGKILGENGKFPLKSKRGTRKQAMEKKVKMARV